MPFDRPSFSPEPERDPDMLAAAASHAARCRHSRQIQTLYAIESHRRAVSAAALIAPEIVPVAGLRQDAYPRLISNERAARLPDLVGDSSRNPEESLALSLLAVSPKADGAAFVALATEDACRRLGLTPLARWVGGARVGSDPKMPLLAAEAATTALLTKLGRGTLRDLCAVELHDAFATQGLAFANRFDIDPHSFNCHGGGIARGHPIAASGAIAVVRVLSDLRRMGKRSANGLAAIAAAGGLGSAALLEAL